MNTTNVKQLRKTNSNKDEIDKCAKKKSSPGWSDIKKEPQLESYSFGGLKRMDALEGISSARAKWMDEVHSLLDN